MTVAFIHSVNLGEGIGTQKEEKTREIVETYFEDKENDAPNGKYSTKARQWSRAAGKRRISAALSKRELETANLCRAWGNLRGFADSVKEDQGLMEVSVIQALHRTLMTGMMDPVVNTPPGRFSEVPRSAMWKGVVHGYPVFLTQEEWKNAIRLVLDQYNPLLECAKRQQGKERLLNVFKCAAYLLYELVSLHPFSDGNGCLCRLLASYCTLEVAPFPSPVHNIFSRSERADFVQSCECALQPQ